MDVFGVAVSAAGDFLRDAAVDAAHELGVFEALREPKTLDELADALDIGTGRRRLRRLLDVLAAHLYLVRSRGFYTTVRVPERPVVARAGWGLMADVIRRDKALPVEGWPTEKRMHEHLLVSGASAAAELARLIAAVLRDDPTSPGPCDGALRPSGPHATELHMVPNTHVGDAVGVAASSLGAENASASAASSSLGAEHATGFGGAATSTSVGAARACASLLDLGGGAGTYSRAWLDAHPDGRATLVDFAEVVGLAREHLAAFGDRVAFIPSEIRAAQLGDGYDVALLANVLHLHDESNCAAIVEVAAKAVAPGGIVVVKDLRMDEGRVTPESSLLFALNMAVYTGGGDVYEGSRIRSWLAQAGLVDIEERRLATSPEAIVVIGRKPAEDAIARELDSELSRMGKVAWRELEAEGRLRENAQPRRLEYPSPLRRMVSRALAEVSRVRDNLAAPAHVSHAGDNLAAPADVSRVRDNSTQAIETAPAVDIRRHYAELMPRMRVAQICGTDEPAATLMHATVDWSRLPRMTDALDRLFDLVARARVDTELPLGAPSAAAFRARTPTLAELYMRTHYGGCMPLLYGYPADLAYFMSRGLDLHATIDRYLTVPVLHELCHFGRYREALPVHLDECVAGYLGVYVWPEFAYPADGEDDAIYAAPWLSQVGQAIARAFGIQPIVRGHTGSAPWRDVVPRAFLDEAETFAWDDWRKRRTLHFLSDTLAPQPWIDLALRHATMGDDDAFDRTIVEDGLRAMCLDNVQLAGSFRTRTRVAPEPIVIDARARSVTTAHQNPVDVCPPWYWLPPAVAARMVAAGIERYSLRLTDIRAIPEAATAICAAPRNCARDGFALVIA